jgi:hypothetical protein
MLIGKLRDNDPNVLKAGFSGLRQSDLYGHNSCEWGGRIAHCTLLQYWEVPYGTSTEVKLRWVSGANFLNVLSDINRPVDWRNWNRKLSSLEFPVALVVLLHVLSVAIRIHKHGQSEKYTREDCLENYRLFCVLGSNFLKTEALTRGSEFGG